MSNARWKEIYDSILVRIESGELPPNTLLPGEVELGELHGVSRLTAHRALYELQRAGFVHRKRRVGTVVLPPKVPGPVSIGAVFFDVSEHFQGRLFASLRGAFSDDFHLAYAETGHDATREAVVLKRLSKETGALVVYPTCAEANDALLTKVIKGGLPVVCIDRVPAGITCDAVLTDNYSASVDGVRGLLEAGHQRVAHFTDLEFNVSSTADRLRGYQDALTSAGLDANVYKRTFPFLGPNNADEYDQMIQLVQDALTAMLHRPEPPTAVFCLRDHYASATAEAARRIGLRLPDDLEILAFVDRPDSMLHLPRGVRRIEQDVSKIGAETARIVQARLNGETFKPQRLMVPARQTVAV